MWQFELDGQQWRWPKGEWLGISGPSGCGKTQLLTRIACGTSGWLQCDQHPNLLALPSHKRGLGWAAQSAPLWPNQQVQAMLGTLAKRHQFNDWQSIAHELHITPLLQQYSDTLSGGERQRVALLAAVICAKHLLLLDEPVSALDANAARQVLSVIHRIATQRQLSAILVSHQWHDLTATCHWVYHWQSNTLSTLADAHRAHVLNHPSNACALWPLDGKPHDGQVLVNGHRLECGPLAPSTLRIRIDAHEVSIARQQPGPSSIANTLKVTVTDLSHISDTSLIATLDWHGYELYALITPKAVTTLGLEKGLSVFAQFKAHAAKPA
ncbi:ATP-binding cassette domain-containing protein [Gilvimarinus polysaccharolyticus]|uniref:ATP-binding cassette domain-containing protein n=1 Tax=Gilvimarinus polysaccharolyticus TaxID=863921 RepID=UPI00067355CB|nr:ATP-binding cassette domain-containing protein [Gilvimarinus polysaccharolyticus]